MNPPPDLPKDDEPMGSDVLQVRFRWDLLHLMKRAAGMRRQGKQIGLMRWITDACHKAALEEITAYDMPPGPEQDAELQRLGIDRLKR